MNTIEPYLSELVRKQTVCVMKVHLRESYRFFPVSIIYLIGENLFNKWNLVERRNN